ncbi:PREDICTED: uncharacterized protein LOC109169455 [Ipomoea nil]|uniref:uncharacterized protein LOC109169455 n=1 Tax=Ipomoea nil TaxID=35883 RepID=UPI000900AE64|nr:PREDICTED: uncharacterized protein LOC109169455 [Ipomoea nil]
MTSILCNERIESVDWAYLLYKKLQRRFEFWRMEYQQMQQMNISRLENQLQLKYIQIGEPIIILEAVADYDLWIWHAHFGMPGSNNDINVLEGSYLFSNLANGISAPCHYVIQGQQYHTGYYLADGIYLKWSTLVQTIHEPRGPKKKLFAMMQEACRKDVERAFGVLQSRFAIVKGPARFWDKCVLHDIMSSCIIMHNMIIEGERDEQADIQGWKEAPTPEVDITRDENIIFQEFLARHRQIKDKEAHYALRNASIEHLWERFSNSDN